jgi:hypothetical protein
MRIEYVSKLMGHSSIKTTQVYAKIVNADLDQAMKDFDATLSKEAEDRKKKAEEVEENNKEMKLTPNPQSSQSLENAVAPVTKTKPAKKTGSKTV